MLWVIKLCAIESFYLTNIFDNDIFPKCKLDGWSRLQERKAAGEESPGFIGQDAR